MAANALAIANSALAKIGNYKITDLSSTTNVQAVILNEQYSKNRDALLRSHPWNFALKRATLVADATAPDWGFSVRYPIPSDCLRILETDADTLSSIGEFDSGPWQKEGSWILTDQNPFSIKYIYQVTDTTLFDACFDEVLACKLAADVCYAITQSTTLADLLEKQYRYKLAEARSFDGQEGGVRQPYAREWLNSRY